VRHYILFQDSGLYNRVARGSGKGKPERFSAVSDDPILGPRDPRPM
jgi:hypothetical protein